MIRQCFLLAIALLVTSSVFAQRAQVTEYVKSNDDVYVEYMYSRIKENDKVLKDGPFSIITTLDMSDAQWRVNYFNINFTGSHNKGYVHGPISLDYARQIYNAKSGYSESRTCKIRGNFVNGVPNNNITLHYIINNEDLMKINATYKNGYLVGKYYIKSANYWDNYDDFEITGTFGSNGKLTGTWTIVKDEWDNEIQARIKYPEKRTYVNSFATVMPHYDQTLKTYAQQFVANKITADQLLEKGVIIKTEAHNFDTHLDLIVPVLVISWRNLGEYNFRCDSLHDNHQYLKYMTTLTDAGISAFKEYVASRTRMFEVSDILNYDASANVYYYQEDNYPDYEKYYTHPSDDGKVYFTKAQTEQILEAVNERIQQNVAIREEEERQRQLEEQKRKEAQLSSARRLVEKSLDNMVNRTLDEVYSNLSTYYSKSTLELFLPIESYKIENVEFCRDSYFEGVKVTVLLFHPKEVNVETGIVKTYGTVTSRAAFYVDSSNRLDYAKTFTNDNIEKIQIGWEQVNKLASSLNQLKADNRFIKNALESYDKLLSDTEKAQVSKLNVDYFRAEYTSVLNYNKAIQELLVESNGVKQVYANQVDIINAFTENFKGLDLEWKIKVANSNAEIEKYDWSSKFNSYLIPIKNRIDDFAQKRGEIKQLDAELKTLKDGAYVLSVYNKYYANVDISADSNFSTEKLDEVKKTQNGFKEILSAANAKGLSKAIKKAGLTDVNEMMSFAQNYTQSKTPQVEESAKEVAKEPVAKETVAKEQVAKEPIVKDMAVKEAKLSNPVEQKAKGYGQYIDLSGLWHPQDDGSGVSVNVNYIGGYRFNSHLFLGLGTGINMNGEKGKYTLHTSSADAQIFVTYFPHSFISIPIYLHFRADFGKAQNLWRPYMSVSAGYHMSVSPIASALSDNFWCDLEYATEGFWSMEEITNKKNKGLLADINFGINRKLSEKLGMYLGVGLKLEPREELGYARPITTESLDYISASSWSSSEVVCAAKLSIGFSF